MKTVPYKVHPVLTDNGTHFTDPAGDSWTAADIKEKIERKEFFWAHAFVVACARNDIDHRLTKPKNPWTNGQVERMNRTIQGRHGQTLPLRDSRRAPQPPLRLRQRLQLRQATQNSQRPHTLRVHLQGQDKRARTIHPQSAPANAGTKHLGGCIRRPLGYQRCPRRFSDWLRASRHTRCMKISRSAVHIDPRRRIVVADRAARTAM